MRNAGQHFTKLPHDRHEFDSSLLYLRLGKINMDDMTTQVLALKTGRGDDFDH
jgi:hypothetical protein